MAYLNNFKYQTYIFLTYAIIGTYGVLYPWQMVICFNRVFCYARCKDSNSGMYVHTPSMFDNVTYGGFLKWRVAKNGWFIRDIPMKMDDMGGPLFSGTPHIRIVFNHGQSSTTWVHNSDPRNPMIIMAIPFAIKKKASHETNPQVTPGGDHPTHDLFQWDQPTWLACSPSKSWIWPPRPSHWKTKHPPRNHCLLGF